MWNYLWPMFLIVGSNIAYNLMTKSTPVQANAFASLTVTYLTAALLSFGLLFATAGSASLAAYRQVNWTALVLGIAIVGLELGYICLYRAGWQISVGSLVANIALAVCLLLIGALLYQDIIGLKQVLGIGFCLIGLVLINLR